MNFRVVEIFSSINGESRRAGELAVFVRLAGCNVRCTYCDTLWALEPDVPFTPMTEDEIYDRILSYGISNVTITGGEPLISRGIDILIRKLSQDENLYVEIETNGSIPIKPYLGIPNRPSMTLDYKLPGSGAEHAMCMENFQVCESMDTVKFVCGDEVDLQRALEIIRQYHLDERCAVYLSPVWGKIDPQIMVKFMLDNHMNRVRLQLQLHKFIWDPDKRGV